MSSPVSIISSYKIKVVAPLLLALFLAALYHKDCLWFKTNQNNRIRPLGQPRVLLNYAEFRAIYPRNFDPNVKLTEISNRQMLFNLDLISLSRHNLAYLMGKETYIVGQSPFKSDRTKLEQINVLNQLDEFNLTKIMSSFGQNNRVSGRPRTTNNETTTNVEMSGKFKRWLKRKVKSNSYFEVPSYPLDKQPDPNRITHIDSDLRDCTGEIRNQRNCGSCYAFSWNSYAEWHYCKQSGKMIDFSEQHIVDCGYLTKLDGCLGGLLPSVKDFSHTFGFILEKDYPYKRKQERCKKSTGDILVRVIDFTRIKVDKTEWEEVLMEQPILLEVHFPVDIMSYQRGVHPGTNCDKRYGHGMILVGYGRQEGVPYWLLKNSMGKKWGENGYLRLRRDALTMKSCFHTGFIAKFKFNSLEEDRYHEFYDQIKFQPTMETEKKVILKKDFQFLFD